MISQAQMSNLIRRTVQNGRRFKSNFAVLTEEFKGTPATKSKAPAAVQYRTSKLQSGITLASRATDSPVAGISVTVQAGSRHESQDQHGSALMLQTMAFQDTTDRSAFTLLRDLQDIGANVSSCATRETITVKVEVLRDHVEAAVAALADTIINPYLPDWVLNEQRPAALRAVEKATACPQNVVTELLHEAAFGEATPLGSTLYSSCAIKALQHDRFVEFRNKTFVAENLVIAANGVDHSTLSSLADAYFKKAPTGKTPPAASPYVGGEARVKAAGPMTHIALGFNGAAFGKEGYDVNEVLSAVLKARLQKAATTSTAFHASFKDTGLIGVYGCGNTADASKVASSLVNALTSVVSSVTEDEVKRAKRKLALARTLMNEHATCTYALSRAAAHGVDPLAFAQSANNVTREAVQTAARNLLQTKPAYVVLGPTARVPRIDDISKLIKQS